MMPKRVVIVGAGKLGSLLLDCLEGDDRWDPVAFIDDGLAGGSLAGLPVFSTQSYDPSLCRDALLAVGFPHDRMRMVSRCQPLDLHWQTYVDRRSQVGSRATVGRGSIFLSFSMLASDAVVGEFTYFSSYSHAGAGAKLGDFNSLMGGAAIGGCVVEDGCTFGLRSACLDGASIGAGATIAPYAFVRRSVPPAGMAVGNPARIVARQAADDRDIRE
jgi:carbonic anhydrase/acetyltransferase-like protein (isoleucine patch superfamily)